MMTEKNTVILDVFEYNRLRDFEKEIIAGNTLYCYSRYNGQYSIFTENDAVKKVLTDNEEWKRTYEELQERYQSLLHPKTEKKELTANEIKRMSFWNLLKWYFKK